MKNQWITRRAFVAGTTLTLLAADSASASDDRPALRVGLLTDLHYADKPPAGTRYYRETLAKLQEAAGKFAEAGIDLLVELGDLIDAADSAEVELKYLAAINREIATISRDRHYVLGNHCVDMLTKPEFLGAVEQAQSYYSFDRGGFHFVVLDACYRSDGQPYGRKNSTWTDTLIPPAELEWLASDLRSTDKKVIVLAHQRLDVANNHGVKNNAEVRKLLEASGRVLAVFQGHSHQNDLKDVNGIHYCTLVAMVEGSGAENSGYSLLNISGNGTIKLEGFRKQRAYHWPS